MRERIATRQLILYLFIHAYTMYSTVLTTQVGQNGQFSDGNHRNPPGERL